MDVRPSREQITEPAREIKVCREADLVVVGGGPAGVAAAIAAGRKGIDTVLVERYGHLGGMATGGLVLEIVHMSGGTEEQWIAGLCQEMVERLDAQGAALHPAKEELGSSDAKVVRRWSRYNPFFVMEGRVRMTVVVDPEILKCVLNTMMDEAHVKLYCHSWASRAIVEDGTVRGVIVESKSGRQAITGRTVIDATGDGDIIASAGEGFDVTVDPETRSSNLALVFRVGNIDADRFHAFREGQPDRHSELMEEMRRLGGFTVSLPTTREEIRWFNNWLPRLSAIDAEDLTWVEVNVRKKMLITYDFFKKNVPGFENSFIVDTASQVGTRGSRRLAGEHVVTGQETKAGIVYEDTIAVAPPKRNNISPEHPNACIPYRSLVPRKLEGLLAAGRCFASDAVANDRLNLIPHCVAMGQAAGIAAALAIKNGSRLRDVDYKVLQKQLIDEGVPLPSAPPGGKKRT